MPVNKSLDRVLKAFFDEALRMFLHIMEAVPLDRAVKLTPLPRETAPPVVMPDTAVRVTQAGRRDFIFHTEIERNFRPGKLPVVARYGGGLAAQYRIPVKTVILLLDRLGNPKFNKGIAEDKVGGTRILHPYRIMRFWEMDPAPLFETGDPRLLPWTAMMNSTDKELRATARELRRLGDEELIGRFRLLASFRYDSEELEEMTGGGNMGFVEFFWENSKLLTEYKAKVAAESRAEGLAEGRATGEAQGEARGQAQGQARGQARGEARGIARGKSAGKAEEARRLLRAALASKFPGLQVRPQLDKITKVKTLEDLLIQHVVGGTDRKAVKDAILKAARQTAN